MKIHEPWRQLTEAQTESRESFGAAWTPLITPSPIAFRFSRDSVPRDSGQLRLKVTPAFAEIYIDGIRIGTNFKQVMWPVGDHTIRFVAPGCGTVVEQIVNVMKGQLLIVPPVTIPGSTRLTLGVAEPAVGVREITWVAPVTLSMATAVAETRALPLRAVTTH